MAPVSLVLMALMHLRFSGALYNRPVYPEISNDTFHYFFVPDGDYAEDEDPEICQMLFKFTETRTCFMDRDPDSVLREDLIIIKHQVEDTARSLESIERSIAYDLDGEQSYGKYISQEIAQISEAFTDVDTSLLELEMKFKQNRDNDLREEHQINENVLHPIYEMRDTIKESMDTSVGLGDKYELLSLMTRSHATRLSRLKAEYMSSNV